MFAKQTIIIATIGILATSRILGAITSTSSPGPDDFILSDGTNVVSIFAESAENHAVARAVGDLAEDVFRVTSLKPDISSSPTGKQLVIVGTLGVSKTVDRLAAEKKLDDSGVRGQWESYVLQVVKDPLPGVDSALVIAGSDRRGTIYGIYQLSETIGVSPWYWWADVPVKTNQVIALQGDQFKQGPPAVKYRGIFINAEAWGLRLWAAKTFDTNTANIGPNTYEKVFELLLRLRANYLWPAMHAGTRAFNSFPTNKELADLYGIVMGSSHCEQMLCNNVEEWATNKFGEYNYVDNRDGVLKYWEQRVKENGRFENVYTVGMRGIHDSGMPGGGKPVEKAKRLHKIIDGQRKLLRRHVNKDVAEVPQIFVPYKESLELYRLEPDLPKDITLVWPDDNYGYVRQFSNEAERKRSGGAGVYYHLSYLGRPASYLWLCSTPPALIAEEMYKAYKYGADRLWIANVGDIKPAEVATEFFLRLAWNPDAWRGTNVNELLARQFARDFGPEHAEEISGIMGEYYRLNFQRKPEHLLMTSNNLSVARPIFSDTLNGDETTARVDAWRKLTQRLTALEAKLSPNMEDCIFELVGYGVYSSAVANERAISMNRFNAGLPQGRAAAFNQRAIAKIGNDSVNSLTANYNTKAAIGGKWMHMFDSNPGGQPFFIPTNAPVFVGVRSILGLTTEGSEQFFRADQTNAAESARLPRFSKLTQRPYFVELYSASNKGLDWQAVPSADWIRLDHSNGKGDARVWVSVNWSNAPAGDISGSIRFLNGTNQELSVAVSAWSPSDDSAIRGADFVEDNFQIAMEAEHASSSLPGKSASWQEIAGLGYNGEAMTIAPVTATSLSQADAIIADSPCLQYKFWIGTPGDWTVTVRSLPTFSVDAGQPQRYAIAVDDAAPQIVCLTAATDEHDKQWQENVLRNAALTTSQHPLAEAGRHTLNIWMVDPGIVLDTIFATTTGAAELGYVGPAETRIVK